MTTFVPPGRTRSMGDGTFWELKMSQLRTAIRLALATTLSNREVGRQTGLAYNTIRRYRSIAEANQYDLERLLALSDADLLAKFNKRGTRHSNKRLPDFSHIHRELPRKGVTLTLLWVEYKEEEPETAYGLSTFTELYRRWAGKHRLSMRQQYAPGERGWVDFSGTRMGWADPATGEYHDTELFVATIGVSNLLFVNATPSQRKEHWIGAHCNWYEALGGVPSITVSDNLKSAVLRPGRNPIFNPAYLDMGEHYGTILLPARPGRPKDKPAVEGSVLIFLRWGIARLRNRTFHSLAELNAAIVECVDLINNRAMRRYKQSRRERFELLDKAALLPLPVRYAYGEWFGPLRVPPDYHVSVEGHFYSVPHRLIQQEVYVRCSADTIEILCDRKRVASHPRSGTLGDKTTDRAHMPKNHLAWANNTPERYQSWAGGIGAHSRRIVDSLLEKAKHPAAALNACATLQKLSRTHGVDRFERACMKALSIQSPTVKSIRSILQNRLEERPEDNSDDAGKIREHPNIRGPNYYAPKEHSHVD